MPPAEEGSPTEAGFLAQVLVNDHDAAHQGAEDDAGQEGGQPEEQEGGVVLGRQWGLLARPEGLVPEVHDRVRDQLLREHALERTLLWKRKAVVVGTGGSWVPGTGGTAGLRGTEGSGQEDRDCGAMLAEIAQGRAQRAQ